MSGIATGSVQIMRTIIIMSLTGSAIALLLFILKPLMRDRLPKLFQYYMWLAVLAALLLPISKIVILPEPPATPSGQTVSLTPIHDIVHESFFAIDAIRARSDRSAQPPEITGDRPDAATQNQPPYAETQDQPPDAATQTQPPDTAATAVFAIWLLGAAAFAGRNVTRYMRFSRSLRKRFKPADVRETAMLMELRPKGRIPSLHRSLFAPTPMLIGIIHPSIVLPDKTYTDTQLRNILLHELTHLRRRDVIMKWLSMLASALHWFNPIAYLVRREINSSCELACDEIIISTLDRNGKQNYGDTLIAAVAAGACPQTRLSTTMSEEKRAIKERLGSIMKYKSFSMTTIILSCVLLVVVICGAFFLGAASGGAVPVPEAEINTATPPSSISADTVELPSDAKNVITLDDIRHLAKKGNELTADDFFEYDCVHTEFDGGESWEYPVQGGMWRLEVNINFVDGAELMTAWLIPSGYRFRPQGAIDICGDSVDEYISYVERYDGTQTQLTDSEEAAARASALAYYKDWLTGIDTIEKITDDASYASAVIVQKVQGKIAGYSVTTNDKNPPRLIVLTQTNDNDWVVINEGY